MNTFNQASELSQIETNIHSILQNKPFRHELITLLLSGLRTFGFKASLHQLEQESGVKLPSGFSDEFKEFVLQGRFDQALGNKLI